MTRRAVAIGAVVAVVVVVLWYVFLFSPRSRDLSRARDETAQANRDEQALRAQLRSLQELDRNGPQIDAELRKLDAAVPATPDLASFIRSANEIAAQSGIDWLSVSPTEPTGTSIPAEIKTSVQIQGGFFQVLDYLNRLEALDRLVVVDGINVTTSGSGSGTGGAPDLAVTLDARMFTQQAASPTGTSGATTSPGGTTTSSTGAAPTGVPTTAGTS